MVGFIFKLALKATFWITFKALKFLFWAKLKLIFFVSRFIFRKVKTHRLKKKTARLQEELNQLQVAAN